MQVLKVTSTAAAVSSSTIVHGLILVAGTANAAITLNDSLAGDGSDKAAAKALAYTSSPNAVPIETSFSTGVYATISGTGAIAYIFVD